MTEKTTTYLYDSDPEIELMDHFIRFLYDGTEQKEHKTEQLEGDTIVNLL